MSQMLELSTRLFAEIAEATRDTQGVTREAFGAGEETALRILEAEAQKLGLHSERDALQNLWLRLPEDDGQGACTLIGSHVDSVPQGGNFDGLAGVVAGVAVLDEIRRRGLKPPRPVRVLAMRAEESAWYGKAYIGSLALFGQLGETELAAKHRSGQGTLAEAMAAAGVNMDLVRAGQFQIGTHNVAAYLELHIEQGPVMVAREWPVAVVSGIRGNIRHNQIRCLGETGHSGAVPRWLRKDAVLAVADLLSKLDDHWRVLLQMGMDMVMTSGICTTPPKSHAVSVIPGEMNFSFEVRSQDAETMDRFYTLMREECAAIEQARGVRFEFDRKVVTAPASLDAGWCETLRRCAGQRGLTLEDVPSGAGHDAAVFSNAGIPSAMLFIRNQNGSHNPAEAMRLDDFVQGCELLCDAVTYPLT